MKIFIDKKSISIVPDDNDSNEVGLFSNAYNGDFDGLVYIMADVVKQLVGQEINMEYLENDES